MVGIRWNGWTISTGIGGQITLESLGEFIGIRIFHDMFTPPKLEFLDQVIERIFAQHAQAPEETARLRQGELARARAELEHVKEAIRQGILTPTTKTMLEEAERRVAECEAAVAAAQKMPAKIEPPSISIGRYLEDLRGALETKTDRARRLLAKMLGKVTLRRDGTRLLADVKGDLPSLLDVDEEVFGRAGAGRGIQALSVAPWMPLMEPGRRVLV